jgi:hypothetical protein
MAGELSGLRFTLITLVPCCTGMNRMEGSACTGFDFGPNAPKINVESCCLCLGFHSIDTNTGKHKANKRIVKARIEFMVPGYSSGSQRGSKRIDDMAGGGTVFAVVGKENRPVLDLSPLSVLVLGIVFVVGLPIKEGHEIRK